MTPLIFAVLSDRTETMEYLVKAGANLNAQNKVLLSQFAKYIHHNYIP